MQKSEWLKHFEKRLSDYYEIKFYDACTLGGINLDPYEEKNLHQQFLNFGIARAVKSLAALENDSHIYIGCSIGGLIAWKAGLMGLPMEKLICISSTRIRMETQKPACAIHLFFGNKDDYRPDVDWMKLMNIESSVLLQGDHDIYKNAHGVNQIVQSLVARNCLELEEPSKNDLP